jgi:hypothetical protein
VLTLESVSESIFGQWDDDSWIVAAKSYQPYFVVDGQQRLTTAIILIQSILEQLHHSDKLNYTDRADIQRKFIFDSKDDGISRSYIFGYEKDNPSYEFLKSKIFGERSSTGPLQETVYTQNLAQAKQFFLERVAVLSHPDLEALYRKVTQNLLFNIFTTHRSLILETCLKIWKFSLQRDNDVEVLWRFPRSLDTMGTNRRSTLALIEKIA